MGMLDRYKKKGGFVQLLSLIETSGKTKQEQFLALVGNESKAWEVGIRQRILTCEKVLSWDQAYLAEILSRLQPLTLAVVLHGNSKERNEAILACLPNATRKRIYEVMGEKDPTPAEVSTCQARVVADVRDLVKNGYLKIEKIDPTLLIPENIEDLLNQSLDSSGVYSSANSGENSPVTDLSVVSSVSASSLFEPQLKFHERSDQKDDVDQLKKKIHNLLQENQTLKGELQVLKGKLEHIRKIA